MKAEEAKAIAEIAQQERQKKASAEREERFGSGRYDDLFHLIRLTALEGKRSIAIQTIIISKIAGHSRDLGMPIPMVVKDSERQVVKDLEYLGYTLKEDAEIHQLTISWE